jgi:hypothetical protein
MEHPDWYPNWRHDAFHQLQGKLEQLWAEFRLGQWPRYDYDLDAGTLTFSDHGGPKVIAEVQIVGSTSAKAGNWLWAWANSNWPAERVTDAQLVRAFGEKHGICELTHEYVEDEDLNALGWSMAAVMVEVTCALGAYRPPREEGGGLYLTYKSIAWAS